MHPLGILCILYIHASPWSQSPHANILAHPPSGRFPQHTKDMECMCPLAAPSRKKPWKNGAKKKTWKENLEPTYQAIRVPIRMRDWPCLKPEKKHNSEKHRPRPKMKASSSNHQCSGTMLVFGGVYPWYILFGHQKFASHPIAFGPCVWSWQFWMNHPPLKEPGKNKLVWNQLVKLGEAKKSLRF